MIKIIFVIFMGISLPVFAINRDNVHYPILAYKAQSLGSGNVAYISYPGSNATSSFLTNAYMIGITNDFDFGVIPLYYTLGGGFFNTNYRYQIINKKNHQVALSLTHLRYNMWENSEQELDPMYSYNENRYTLGFTYNFTPQHLRYNLAMTLNYKRVTKDFEYHSKFENVALTKSGEMQTYIDSYNVESKEQDEVYELILEGNYYIKNKTWMGLSLANMRRDSEVQMGDEDIYRGNQIALGMNLSFQGKLSVLNEPSIGMVHFSRDHQNSLMFSTNF